MSERPKQSQTSSTTEAESLRLDARPGSANVRRSGPAVHPPFARAEPSHQGVPYRIERATLYDPEPLDPPPPSIEQAATLPSPRSLLPLALTLLGVVVVVGLTAGVIVVRNTGGSRTEQAAARLEQFSERELPKPGAVGTRANEPIPYDLTHRPTDTIVGAWRETRQEARKTGSAGAPEPEAAHPDAPQRRPLPRRITILPRWLHEELLAKGDKKPSDVAETAPNLTPSKTEIVRAPADPSPVAAEESDKGGSNVVARVGRTTKPAEPEPALTTNVPGQRSAEAESDDDGGRRVKANEMSMRRYRIWKMQRARARANRPDPYDAFLTEKAAQGIRFYGVHRQNP